MAGPTVKASVSAIAANLPSTLTEEQRTAVLEIHNFILNTPNVKGVRSIERAKIRNAAGLHKNRTTKTGQESKFINSRLGIISPKTGLVHRLHDVADALSQPVHIDSDFSATELGFSEDEWLWLCIPGTFNPWLGLAGKTGHKTSAVRIVPVGNPLGRPCKLTIPQTKRKAPSSESDDSEGDSFLPAPPRLRRRVKRCKRRKHARYDDSDDTGDEEQWGVLSEALEQAKFSDNESETSTDRGTSVETTVAGSTNATTPSPARSKQSSVDDAASPLAPKSDEPARHNNTVRAGSNSRECSPVDVFDAEAAQGAEGASSVFALQGGTAPSPSSPFILDTFLPDFEPNNDTDTLPHSSFWASTSSMSQWDNLSHPTFDFSCHVSTITEPTVWNPYTMASQSEATASMESNDLLDGNDLWGDAHGALLTDTGLKTVPWLDWTTFSPSPVTATDPELDPPPGTAESLPLQPEEPRDPSLLNSPVVPVIPPSGAPRATLPLTRDEDVLVMPDPSEFYLAWDADMEDSFREMMRDVSHAEGLAAIDAFFDTQEEEGHLLG